MFLKKTLLKRKNKTYVNYQIIEAYRAEGKSRQRVVANLGDICRLDREGWRRLARRLAGEPVEETELFSSEKRHTAEIRLKEVRWENPRDFGDVAAALHVWRLLGLEEVLSHHLPRGKMKIIPSEVVAILSINRLCRPLSEHALSRWYRRTALPELLGISADKIDDDRLYRCLDRLVGAKEAIEREMAERARIVFDLEYDLLLYDLTSTYFEGLSLRNEKAKRGYSRDSRSDCPQVCIALAVTKEGFPVAHEVIDGNVKDHATLGGLLDPLERRLGKAKRILIMDRGISTKDNIEVLKTRGYEYVVALRRSELKGFEAEIIAEPWERIREFLEVQRHEREGETVVICRSEGRRLKEEAIRSRFEEKMQSDLARLAKSISSGRVKHEEVIQRRIGRIMERYPQVARLYEVRYEKGKLTWSRRESFIDEQKGLYLLRTNVTSLSTEQIWETYIKLTEAEAAFRAMKSDLLIRPVFHQLSQRVEAHIFVCIIAYLLWKSLERLHRNRGGKLTARAILAELHEHKLADIVLPTVKGPEIRLRQTSQPTKEQQEIYMTLKYQPPKRFT